MKLSKLRKVFLTPRKIVQALIPPKRKRQIISLMLVAFLFESSARAQTGDWQAVENLKTGSYILVKAQHRYQCPLESATDDQLVCGHLPRSLRLPTLIFSRSEIREVRLLPNPYQAKDAWIGAGIGAGAGAITGASTSSVAPGANAFFGALAGAGFGALIGGSVSIFKGIFQRGKLIYKR